MVPSANVRLPRVVQKADRHLGRAVTRAVVAHHRRRLHRIGWGDVLGASPDDWSGSGTPPRRGSLEVLIDGAEALPRIAAELRQAQSHVHLAGWLVSPEFALTRGEAPTVLRNLLAELASRIDVRVLTWAGAPLPPLPPLTPRGPADPRTRLRGNQDRMGPRLEGAPAALSSREDDRRRRPRRIRGRHRPDGRETGIGSTTTLTSHGRTRLARRLYASDRLGGRGRRRALPNAVARGDGRDDRAGRARRGDGGGGRDPDRAHGARAGLRGRPAWRVRHSRVVPAVPSWRTGARLSREPVPVVARDHRDLPRQAATASERSLSSAHRAPSRPNTGTDDTRGALAELVEADDGADRFLACTLYAHEGPFSDPIYVHAKVGVVDDRWMTIGSANLNDHSLFNDTEVNVVTHDAELARETRLRLWAEHLELAVSEVQGDPTRIIDDRWKPIAAPPAARSSESRRTVDAPPRPATPRIAKVRAAARASPGAARRRLTRCVVA